MGSSPAEKTISAPIIPSLTIVNNSKNNPQTSSQKQMEKTTKAYTPIKFWGNQATISSLYKRYARNMWSVTF